MQIRLTVFVGGTMLALETAIFSTVVHYWKKDKHIVENQITWFCVPCASLRLGADEDFNNFRLFRLQKNGNTLECCALAENLHKIADLFSERQWRIRSTIDGSNCSAVVCGQKKADQQGRFSAKLVWFDVASTGNNQSNILLWNVSDPRSYVGDGIVYSNGRLSVEESGFYQLYSTLLFEENNTSAISESIFKTFCHFIYRHRQNTEASLDEKLIQSPQTLCSTYSIESNGTSTIGSVFYLGKADEVMVKVSHPSRIKQIATGSYFGIFKV